ncbi:HNH endonuclease [Escherichia phage RB16]|uniref:RB16 HNH(AP2) 3 n=2 Tax=Pseudotevenvirus RB16 TaxID=329381 RepID=Q4TZV0_9CAUD|nr:HNH endonuclease [Escherichia phage RB16]AAY44388.1 RB16 HNH(AP2) 3 [Pseudotevenvirus RB16]ADJ55368.1 putative homing endonuclease RB16 3 [Escherichia phage RB16]
MITQSRLKELLTYDKETGIFHWKVKLNNNHDITKPAGVVYDGYVRIQVDGKKYRAHRLAWLYVYGYMPELIDHKNGITTDNWIDNLRIASCTQNQYNSKIRKDNTSGIKGVSFHKRTGKWQAKCRVDGIVHYLGLFHTTTEAESAVIAFRHKHHQEYSNDGK